MTPAQAAQAVQGALARGDWDKAVTALQVLALADPRNASIRYNLGLALRRLGKDEEALAALASACNLAPSHLNARFEHAACLMDLGHLDDAGKAFSDYCRAADQDADGWLNLGRIRLRLGDAQGAVEALERCLALRPDDREARLARGEAVQLEDRERGHADLRRLYADHPQDRARLLKAMTQGPRGRLPLSGTRLAVR
uniref:tetratricopeptide repeat protein n=1 Tax=Stappia sp. TaxID=1870903 RepID=UPI003BAB7D4F